MIAYLDTSALLKNYLEEAGSEAVIRVWEASEAVAISAVGCAEAMATFHRKRREGVISREILDEVVDLFKKEWDSLNVLEVSRDLHRTIGHLVSEHPLRGFDAIHLASALVLTASSQMDLVFASADRRLVEAAGKEGLAVQAV